MDESWESKPEWRIYGDDLFDVFPESREIKIIDLQESTEEARIRRKAEWNPDSKQ